MPRAESSGSTGASGPPMGVCIQSGLNSKYTDPFRLQIPLQDYGLDIQRRLGHAAVVPVDVIRMGGHASRLRGNIDQELPASPAQQAGKNRKTNAGCRTPENVNDMRYRNVIPAVFIYRPNRFTAFVDICGRTEKVHVKNTGRCRELLLPGAEIWLSGSENPDRKTAFDLITVRKTNGLLVNIDSQAPNVVAREWLETQHYDVIRPEYRYGQSRLDFMMERGNEQFLMEVKGCTLERDGIGYFPDAPTERGAKHLRELAKAVGYKAKLLFVIQMDGITEVRGNMETDPAFCRTLDDVKKAGVEVICLPCHVEPDGLFFVANPR